MKQPEGFAKEQTFKVKRYAKSLVRIGFAILSSLFFRASAPLAEMNGSSYIKSVISKRPGNLSDSNPAELERYFAQLELALYINGLDKTLNRAEADRLNQEILREASRVAAQIREAKRSAGRAHGRSAEGRRAYPEAP